MSNELRIQWLTGHTLYALAYHGLNVWYPTGAAWETWGTDGRGFTDYVSVNFTETGSGSGRYVADFPVAAASAGAYEDYDIQCFQQDGSSPASTDTPAGMLSIARRDIVQDATPGASGVGELITRVRARAGRSNDSVLITSSFVLDAINDAQLHIVRRLPRQLDLDTQSTTDYQISTDDTSIDLSTINPAHIGEIWILNGSDTRQQGLKYRPLRDFRAKYMPIANQSR